METLPRPLLFARQALTGLVALTLWSAPAVQAEPLQVSFLSPDPPENLFWGNVIAFMEAVADDLDVELDVVVSKGNSTYAMKRDGLEIINRDDPPDVILTGYWNEATDKLLEAAAGEDIDFFLFNTDISSKERLKVGQPRGRHPHWIGHMNPDDSRAGYDLAGLLAEAARGLERPGGGPIKIAGLSGTADSAVSGERTAGLRKRAESSPDLAVADIVHTTWHRETAEKATETLLEKHPDLTVIWTVADALALGAIDTLKANGRQPGVDAVTGGIDWSDEAIQAVKRGEMVATLGGHFMEGGWALILAHDYHRGIDFADDTGLSIVAPMQAITAENVDRYTRRLGDRDWGKINFKRFSKHYNPSLEQYDFSLDALLEDADSEE